MRKEYNLSTGKTTELDSAVVTPIVLTKQQVIDAINVHAGNTQLRIETDLISPGYGRKDQYAQSSVQVVAWRAAGSPADAVPALIVSWAEARSITNEAGAVEIEGQKAYMESKVEAVFDIRVKGTEAIKALSSGYEAAAQTYYDQLDALTA